MTRNEHKTRLYANHLALTVRRRRGMELLDLFERYGGRRIGGPFRSWRAVHRALIQYSDAELKRLGGR